MFGNILGNVSYETIVMFFGCRRIFINLTNIKNFLGTKSVAFNKTEFFDLFGSWHIFKSWHISRHTLVIIFGFYNSTNNLNGVY